MWNNRERRSEVRVCVCAKSKNKKGNVCRHIPVPPRTPLNLPLYSQMFVVGKIIIGPLKCLKTDKQIRFPYICWCSEPKIKADYNIRIIVFRF